MKPWILPTAILLAGTLVSAGAALGLNSGLGAALSLGEGKTIQEVSADRPAQTDTPGDPTPEPSAHASPSTPRIGRHEYISTIVRRNIFDHQNVGKELESPDSAPGAGEAAGFNCDPDDEDCVEEIGEKSDLPVSLLGTVVVRPTEYSSALIMDNNSKETRGYGIGHRLLDSTITAIQMRRVLVQRSDGRREYISLDEDDRPAPTRSTPSTGGSGDDQIMQESEDSYVIDRQLFDASLQDLDALSRMARAIPHKDSNGQPDGFRLSGVRRDQLLYNLGIRSGDIIHGVNGQPLTSIAEAMNAMQTLQRESSFTFEVTRRGQKKTMSYRVR